MYVVEPGCGAGRLTTRLAEWVGPNGRVLAFDPSAGMVEAHLRDVPAANVACVQACAESVELPAKAADRVICFCVFPHFVDKVAALSNLRRAMKPDGLLCVAHLHTRNELNHLHADAGQAVQEDRLPTEDVMRELFADAGLAVDELVDGRGRYHLRARLAR